MNLERKTYENPEGLRKYRKKLIQDAIRTGTKPERVPVFSNVWTWKFLDAGYSLREGLYDYDKAYDAVCEHHEKYEMDLYIDMGARNPVQVTDCYGESLYVIDDERNYMNIKDFALMDEDDYDTFLADGPIKYFFERAVPARYGITDREEMIRKYGKAAHEYQRFSAFNKRVANQYVNVYGVPSIGLGKPNTPMDVMINGMRGMRGTAMDMRKRPEKLEAALEVLSDWLYPAVTNAFKNYDPEDDKYALFARITSLAHTMLNPKQFGKYSWPFYQKFCQDVADRDWCGWLFFEGSVAHIVDYLREIPAGHFALLIEQDDPVWLKKELPNLTICGGYPVELLQNGTEQQCIDKAKQLIDEMAWDGKYIFSTDKMMSFPQDGKGENLKAVIEFVKEYGRF